MMRITKIVVSTPQMISSICIIPICHLGYCTRVLVVPSYTVLRKRSSRRTITPSRDAVSGPFCCGDYSSAARAWKSKSRVHDVYFSGSLGNDSGACSPAGTERRQSVRFLRPEKLLTHQTDS